MTEYLSAFAVVLSIASIVYTLQKRVFVQVINIDDQQIQFKWDGKVTRNILRLETDGESVIISDKLLPLHDKAVTVIVLPKYL